MVPVTISRLGVSLRKTAALLSAKSGRKLLPQLKVVECLGPHCPKWHSRIEIRNGPPLFRVFTWKARGSKFCPLVTSYADNFLSCCTNCNHSVSQRGLVGRSRPKKASSQKVIIVSNTRRKQTEKTTGCFWWEERTNDITTYK